MSLGSLKVIRDRCDDIADCWIWVQGVNSAGYPQAYHLGRTVLVRRHAFALRHGYSPDPRYRAIHMACGERLCCNPRHMADITRSQSLEAAYAAGRRQSPTERMRRALAQARHVDGLAHARRIRADQRSAPAVAAELGCSVSLIHKIRQGSIWPDRWPQSTAFAMAA